MSDVQHGTRNDRYSVAEDFALDALLAIEDAWKRAHRGGELAADPWGEGPSRLRLADLGLDARVRTHALIGACPRHSEFFLEWTGLIDEEPPEFARCTATNEGERCPLSGPVRHSRGGQLPKR